MKSNLFKKIGAMVTIVAMVASLGTVAFADASITIGTATISEPVNGVRTVTVPYTTTGVTGEVAVLGYVGTQAANDVETYADYDDSKHTIVGIEQEGVKTSGTPSITFKVKHDESTDQSNVKGKEYLYITLGAQDVNTAAEAVVPLATLADTTITATAAAWAGAVTDEVANGSNAEAKLAAAKAVIDAGKVKFDATYDITVADLKAKSLITIGEPTVDGNKYTFALTFTAGDTGVDSSDGKNIVLGTVPVCNVDITITEAAAPPAEEPDNYVTIGAAAATWNGTDEVFDVTVPYATTNAKASGEVAMMTYIGKTDAFTGDEAVDFTNETDMRIIGIAQKTNGADGTGTFTYKVMGDVGANTYMVVKVGAQGVDVAPDIVAIPLVKPVDPDDINAAYGTVADLTDLANDSNATIAAALNGKTVSIKDADNAEVATYTLGADAAVTKLATAETVNGATYNYTTTIAAATDVTETGANTNVIIPADFKVYFNITVAAVKWTVASGTMEAIEVNEIADADDDAEVLAAVKKEIVGKKITLTSGTTGQTAETTVVDTWAVAKVDADTYEVTVPADATLTNVLPDGAEVTGAQVEVQFDVTVNEIPDQAVTLTTATLEKNEDTVTDAADAEAAVKAIKLTLSSTEPAYTVTKTIDEWITDAVVTIATASAESPYDYTVTVAAGKTVATNVTTGTIDSLTVTITVQAAPAGFDYMLGDVAKNGEIQHADWQAVLNHVTNRNINADLNDKTTEAFMSADVAQNGLIQHADWQAILNHVTNRNVNEDIGATFNSADYPYKD